MCDEGRQRITLPGDLLSPAAVITTIVLGMSTRFVFAVLLGVPLLGGLLSACGAGTRRSRLLGIVPCGGPEDIGNCDCDSDGDCDEQSGGMCLLGPVRGYGTNPGVVQRCRYPQCRTDADCGEGRLCRPGDGYTVVSTCYTASCRVTSDCAKGHVCVTLAQAGRDDLVSHCVAPADMCDPAACRDQHLAEPSDRYGCYFDGRKPGCLKSPEPIP